MKRLLASALAVLILFVPLLFHETQQSPAGDRIRAICVPALERALETGMTNPSVLADPLVVVCRSLAVPQSNDPIDTAVLIIIAVASVLAVLGLLFGTNRDDWGARNIGVFWVFAGLAILFVRGLAVRWGWTTSTAPSAEPLTDFTRSVLIVGGVVFVWARFDWARERWRARHV